MNIGRLSEENRALMLRGRRNTLEDRATEMRELLLDIVAQIDAGRFETEATGELIERVAALGASRRRLLTFIGMMEGKA